MNNKHFYNKPRLIFYMLMIAAASISVRALIEYRYFNTALLYVGVPFLISLALILIRNPHEPSHWKQRFLNRVIDAFIIMLGSSVVLFEGFVCVVMFIPIYLAVILIMFISALLRERAKQNGKGSFSVHILPVMLAFSAFEGVTPEVSFQRDELVSVTRIVNSSIPQIKQNLLKPIELQKNRQWFLYLFPMPVDIKAETLTPGSVHEIYFEYYRWFFTNLHTGRMLLEISEVGEKYIRTTFLEDTSYIANYLKLQGTEIHLEAIDNNHTRITLNIKFKRTLDPYWYFSPIERYGISKTADFLISEVIAREYN